MNKRMNSFYTEKERGKGTQAHQEGDKVSKKKGTLIFSHYHRSPVPISPSGKLNEMQEQLEPKRHG